jgi:hypothetical protein
LLEAGILHKVVLVLELVLLQHLLLAVLQVVFIKEITLLFGLSPLMNALKRIL